MVAVSEKERYQRYLCSREWAERRMRVMARCDGRCERCRDARASHVHHLTYARKYRELPEDLQALCEPCHEFVHGKRDRDPAGMTQPRLFGREIDGVYLAGKITGDPWRDGIMSHGESGYSVSEDDEWWFRKAAIEIPGSRHRLGYHGPFWIDLLSGHGSMEENEGQHACGCEVPAEHGMTVLETPRDLVRAKCFQGIIGADLVFAWIDSLDCFGTLAEISFAYALRRHSAKGGPVIVVASPNDFRYAANLWFVTGMADHHVLFANTPGEAWKKLWRNPPTEPLVRP